MEDAAEAPAAARRATTRRSSGWGERSIAALAALFALFLGLPIVTLVARAPAISERVKYWIKPDLENRIAAGKIRTLFHSRIVAIEKSAVRIEGPSGEKSLRADAVFPLIGYEPDFAFFERCGIRLEGEKRIPSHDLETLESNVPNLYLAGAILLLRPQLAIAVDRA